ncbi:hypothetical protein [Microbacterium foliorum]|uniref:hypothetical protein n=1 Tax=Microbacterium foliorum TaxID=104336 RepID=UPI003735F15C
MNYWQTMSPEYRARLEDLALTMLACRDAFHETADTFHWEPGPGSPAADDAKNLPTPDPLISNPIGETGHRLLAEVVQTFLLSASGHLGGLAGLYMTGEIVFSPPVLIRSILENCAHAVWVLGEEGEPAEDRLARCYLEEFISAEQARTNSKYMRGEGHESHIEADKAYQGLVEQIKDRFPGASVRKLKEGLLLGQELPGLNKSVKLMYSLAEASGGTVTQDQASGIYGFLSNMTHPTLYPARQRRRWYADPEHGHRVAYLDVRLGSVESEARVALSTFYNALTYVTSYFGWPSTIMEALEAKIEATIPNFFR